jgi:hypothetical protein
MSNTTMYGLIYPEYERYRTIAVGLTQQMHLMAEINSSTNPTALQSQLALVNGSLRHLLARTGNKAVPSTVHENRVLLRQVAGYIKDLRARLDKASPKLSRHLPYRITPQDVKAFNSLLG